MTGRAPNERDCLARRVRTSTLSRSFRDRALAVRVAVVLCSAVLAAQAAPTPPTPVSVASREHTADVIVNGHVVIRLDGPRAGELAAAAARRLAALAGPAPPSIVVETSGSGAVLRVNDAAILAVDHTYAAARGVGPRQLAAAWGRQIRAAIPRHRISPGVAAVVVQPGQRVAIPVDVFPRVRLSASGYNSRMIRVGVASQMVIVAGVSLGSTQVRLRAGRTAVDLAVAVRLAAARLPRRVAVSVTGDPADPDLIREAVSHAIARSTAVRRGSQIRIGSIDPPPLRPGDRASVPVTVTVRNPQAAAVADAVSVVISNVALIPATPSRLLVSNHPETVTANGVLFEESLRADESVRLLYHHRNGASTKKVITVTLTNSGDEPATTFLTGAAAGPSTDVMYTGYAATRRFVRRIAAGQGYLLEVPPRSAHTFAVVDVPPGALVTGFLQAQLLHGTRATVSVQIRAPWLLARTVTTEVNQVAVAHPRGAFGVAEVRLARSVRTGERVVLTDLGFAVTPEDPLTGERLRGDYGILYRLTVELVNPLDRPAVFDVSARAVTGPSRGMLLVERTIADFGLLPVGEERSITAFEVGPNDTRTVEILTMPVAGSFYPVRLTVQGSSR